MLSVDRGRFLPAENRESAYRDDPMRHGNVHLSAPSIYARALEALRLARRHSFLNIGSGTGYLSSIVAELLGGTGVNDGIETDGALVSMARKLAAPSCRFITGNGLLLSSYKRTYDRVYCGAECPRRLIPRLQSLLKPGGVLVVPSGNELIRISRTDTGGLGGPPAFSTETLTQVRFSQLSVPPRRILALSPELCVGEDDGLSDMDMGLHKSGVSFAEGTLGL